MLGIETATAPVLLEAWHNLAMAHPGTVPDGIARNIKGIIMQIGQLIDAEAYGNDKAFDKYMKKILATPCLPVTQPPKTDITLHAPSSMFFINDHQRYSQLLYGSSISSGLVNILNLDIDECRRLQHLLSTLGIQDRFLSQHVSETSLVPEDTQLESSLTTEFRSKAYALSW